MTLIFAAIVILIRLEYGAEHRFFRFQQRILLNCFTDIDPKATELQTIQSLMALVNIQV